MMNKLTCAVLCVLAWCGPAAASSGKFYFENDLFGGSDRYYTNAVRLEVNHDGSTTPGWVEALGLDDVGYYSLKGKTVRSYRVGYYLSHYMFTASDIAFVNPPPGDRPYFGWLTGGVTFERAHTAGYGERLSLGVGVTGPSAKADQLQSWVHDWRSIGKPQGWDTQAGDEATIDLSYTQTRKMVFLGEQPVAGPEGVQTRKFLGRDTSRPRSYLELLPRAGFDFGTTFDQVRLGAQLRAGPDLPRDFGAYLINPSNKKTPSAAQPAAAAAPAEAVVATPAPVAASSASSSQEQTAPKWNWYVFVDVEGRAVGRNAGLDGPFYRGGGRSVDSKPFVGEFRIGGVVMSPWGYYITYALSSRTKEFEGQEFEQSFGSLQLGWDFDGPRME